MIDVDIHEITILPHRHRQDFNEDALLSLGESIAAHGLFYPPTLRPSRDGEAGTWVLLQGERRVRAIRDYVWGLGETFELQSEPGRAFSGPHLPCFTTAELSPIEAEEAEYEENVRRENLTWQERCDADARLAGLRGRQAELAGKPAPTIAQIAEEIQGSSAGWNHEQIRREVIVAKYLGDPEVAKQKTLDDAWKLLKQREEKRKNAELGQRVGLTFSANLHQLLNVDALTNLRNTDAGQYDVILTDPPYGMNAQDFGDAAGKVMQVHSYDDSPEAWLTLMTTCAKEWYRVAKPQAHAYICCDIDRFHALKDFMEDEGWWVNRTPFIIYKLDGNRVPYINYGPQRKWEMLLYANKGKRPVLGIFPDVIETRGDPNLGHGAQKPVELFINLLKRSVNPGDSILDSFCGTGTCFPAGHAFKCKVTGTEIDPVSYGIAVQRLEGLK